MNVNPEIEIVLVQVYIAVGILYFIYCVWDASGFKKGSMVYANTYEHFVFSVFVSVFWPIALSIIIVVSPFHLLYKLFRSIRGTI